MFARLLPLIAVCVYALSWWSTTNAPPRRSVTASLPRHDPQLLNRLRERIGEPLIGFSIGIEPDTTADTLSRDIDAVAALGCNSVTLVTASFQGHGGVDYIESNGPEVDRALRLLDHGLRYAKQRGLATVVLPIVLLSHPRGGEWRGQIQPARWNAWWDSYRAMLTQHLNVAAAANADVFCVGSELISTEHQDDAWRRTIALCRDRFDGVLTYSANFDAYSHPVFWQYLDAVGMNGYFDVATGATASPPDDKSLAANWRAWRQRLLAFAAIQERPLLITELGYPNLPHALRTPWDYTNPKNLPGDDAVQAAGYRAFLNAWQRDMRQSSPDSHAEGSAESALLGVQFWRWNDPVYGVAGREAEGVLRAALRR